MIRDSNLQELITKFQEKDRLALARIITIVENEPERAKEIFDVLYKNAGKAFIVGITGSPGSGKSTLISRLAQEMRSRGKTVGIISIDPSSPFSGGAFLGDRVRMREIVSDPQIFIRSVASRGISGGLSKATYDIATVFDAYGKDYIIIETVGAGQAEVDVIKIADTVVCVFMPGAGDSIQAQKAGIIEIGDILVVNKADLNGDKLVLQLELALDSYTRQTGWRPPVLSTVATDGVGIKELLEAIEEHRKHIEQAGLLEERRRNHIEKKIREIVESLVQEYIYKHLNQEKNIENLVEKVYLREENLYSAAEKLLKPIIKKFEE
ncbi:MAG: methylmalonyl Co-A mutase-associated GTPase MeaB [Candidatus Jordarchaeum sp.]|uniref:methylmalonyl Co-A mutase-associated GTPase MeaB n=1 Tax=Candidatus Jordarchaeum sp. TaxID=2823881 RepID=UPI00404B5DE0